MGKLGKSITIILLIAILVGCRSEKPDQIPVKTGAVETPTVTEPLVEPPPNEPTSDTTSDQQPKISTILTDELETSLKINEFPEDTVASIINNVKIRLKEDSLEQSNQLDLVAPSIVRGAVQSLNLAETNLITPSGKIYAIEITLDSVTKGLKGRVTAPEDQSSDQSNKVVRFFNKLFNTQEDPILSTYQNIYEQVTKVAVMNIDDAGIADIDQINNAIESSVKILSSNLFKSGVDQSGFSKVSEAVASGVIMALNDTGVSKEDVKTSVSAIIKGMLEGIKSMGVSNEIIVENANSMVLGMVKTMKLAVYNDSDIETTLPIILNEINNNLIEVGVTEEQVQTNQEVLDVQVQDTLVEINFVPREVVSIQVDPPAYSLANGTWLNLTATATYDDGSNEDITNQAVWVSDNDQIVFIESYSNGQADAVGLGSTTIRASFKNQEGTANITVTDAILQSIQIDPIDPSLAVGLSLKLTAQGTYSDGTNQDVTELAEWSSSDEDILTVETVKNKGKIFALGEGQSTITANVDGFLSHIEVTTNPAVLQKITVSPNGPSIARGTEIKLSATGTYSDGQAYDITDQVTWDSSNDQIASVTNYDGQEGTVKGIKNGVTSINAKKDGIVGENLVSVSDAVLTAISIEPIKPVVIDGYKENFQATGTYSDGTNQDVTEQANWKSSDKDVATISNVKNEEGTATSLSEGETTISASIGEITTETLMTVAVAELISIEIEPAVIDIAKGFDQQLTATGVYTNGTAKDITSLVSWSSMDSTIAPVSNAAGKQGYLTAQAVGTATIKASLDGKTVEAEATISEAVLTSIEVNSAENSIPMGNTTLINAMGIFSDSNIRNLSQDVIWTSSNEDVAIVENSSVKGLGLGTATITAEMAGITASIEITITQAELVSIELSPQDPSIISGLTEQMVATGIYTDGTSNEITSMVGWSTVDPGVVVVSGLPGQKGKVSTVAVGITQVKASYQGIEASSNVSVTEAELRAIEILPNSVTLAKGYTEKLTATGIYTNNTSKDITSLVVWETTNIAVVPVSNTEGLKGEITARLVGKETVSASLNGITGQTEVTVNEAELLGIEVSYDQSTIPKGVKPQIMAVGLYSDNTSKNITTQVFWTSSDSTIASISNVMDQKGLVTTKTTGEVVIKAELNGVSGSKTIIVTEPVLTEIQISPVAPQIVLGYGKQFTAMGNYTDGTTMDITSLVLWESLNMSVAVISNASGNKGALSSVSEGLAQITASYNGITGQIETTITPAVLTSIEISPTNPSIALGYNSQFTATGIMSDGSSQEITQEVTWESSDPLIAPINNALGYKGFVTTLKVGSVTITASQSGITAQTLFIVNPAVLLTIEVTPTQSSIAKGTSQQMTATGIYSDGSNNDITSQVFWSSSDNAIGIISNTVGKKGNMTAENTGSCDITATMGEIQGITVATVTPAELLQINITPSYASIAKGYNSQFTATGIYTDASKQDLTNVSTWTSDNTDLVQISNTSGSRGLASTLESGDVVIKASYLGIWSDTLFTVTPAELVSIEVTPPIVSMAKGTSQQMTATGIYSDGSNQNLTSLVTWSSSSSIVASISNAQESIGVVTANQQSALPAEIKATIGMISGLASLTVTAEELVSIEVTPTQSSIAKGYGKYFTATGIYTDASTQDLTNAVTWSSSSILEVIISNAVGTKGLATTYNTGTVTISAQKSGITGSTQFTVTPAVLEIIEVNPQGKSVAKGLSQKFSATGVYSDGSATDLTNQVTWSSSDTNSVTISNAAGSQGTATTSAIGTVEISAEIEGITGSASISVTSEALVSLEVTPTQSSIAKGYDQTLTATGLYTDNSTKDITNQVTWFTSDNQVAVVSNAAGEEGLARSIDIGSAVVTAQDQNGITGTANITVTPAELVSIEVTPADNSISLGLTKQYTATGVYSDGTTQDITSSATWSTPNYYKVNISNATGSNGLATTLKVGSATIKATKGAIEGQTTLTINSASLVSIEITPAIVSIADGLSEQFTATGVYTDGTTQDLTSVCSWSSSNTDRATVSNLTGSEGLATGKSVGIVTINCKKGGISGESSLTVTSAELVSISVTPQDSTVIDGLTKQFTATGVYSNGSNQDITSLVTWSSTKTGKASISNAVGSKGEATGKAAGSTTIKATYSGKTGSTGLTVAAAELVSIDISPLNTSTPLGKDHDFIATGNYTDGTNVNLTNSVLWESSNTNVVSISNASGTKGLATSIATGTVEITASKDGISSKTIFSVTDAVLNSITISNGVPSNYINIDAPKQYKATGRYTNGNFDITNHSSLVWSSPNTGRVSVSNAAGSQGLASGIKPGSVTIKATLGTIEGSRTATVRYVVRDIWPQGGQTIWFSGADGVKEIFAKTKEADGTNKIITGECNWSTSYGDITNRNPSNGTTSATRRWLTYSNPWATKTFTVSCAHTNHTRTESNWTLKPK